MQHKKVQLIAKQTMDFIRKTISPGMKLTQVRRLCEDKMLELGADSFWYWDIGAFIFSGDETTKSVSGKEYKTSDRYIEENDIVTIDLSPQCNYIWGDFARTIIIEEGYVVDNINCIQKAEWKAGLLMEQRLHQELLDFVDERTTFEELFYYINTRIVSEDFINLDFLGNLGHSIEKRSEDRIYIEKGNQTRLGDISYFTFEPHISRPDSVFGYKWENVYYFENGKLKML
ncbi:MAG TPA: aminopeptidase P family protein [Candidatus Anaerobutyricum stercoris]|uniref:Aminopeptidase P family protein n=1 Tax=Candidatus Anaerobutyricum stercoris TaxID=2838457 RepID=A0A9D2J7Z8_9FIRM|nr:aminopeptidase P family protein [Candidatus Anaerobutyricum stercoris]